MVFTGYEPFYENGFARRKPESQKRVRFETGDQM